MTSTNKMVRHTARGIIIKDSTILLMERWRAGMHYFSIPGGEIEIGETPEQAVSREIMEETSLTIRVGQLLYVVEDPAGHDHKIFACEWLSGEPVMSESAPERVYGGDDNRYQPRWIALDEVKNVQFAYWQPVSLELIHDIEHGFSKKPKVLAAN